MENFPENDTFATENEIVGVNNDFSGGDNNIDGVNNNMPITEDHVDGTDAIDETENVIDGAANPIDEGCNSLVGVTEITKDQQQGHFDDAGAKSSEKRWPGWPGDTVFRLLVPSHKVGSIIGRKGEFIKKMCEESKARIKILEGHPGAPERAVLISAREEQELPISPAMDGLLRIHRRAVEGLDGDAHAPQNAGNVTATRLLAPATQTGNLIGKQGATIKSIQEASKCMIRVSDDVPPFALPDDKVVEIQGEPTAMHKALELIASHLRKFLVDRSVIPTFENLMSRSFSHMQQQNMPPPPPWGHPQGPPPNHAGSGFTGNPQFMPPMPHDNFYPPPELPPFEKTPHYGISTFGRDVPPMGVHPSTNQHGQPLGNQGTQHMQVPISFADAVIGAAGANISYIRRASGATITIQETRGVPGEMTVEINGSATQIQTAKQLIQNFMAEAGAAAPQSTVPPVDHSYGSYMQSYGSTYSAPLNSGPAVPGGGYGSSYGPSYGY